MSTITAPISATTTSSSEPKAVASVEAQAYDLHGLIRVATDAGIAAPLRDTIDFQIGHFRGAGDASRDAATIRVHRYIDFPIDDEPMSIFHGMRGRAGATLHDTQRQVVHAWTGGEWDLYADSDALLINIPIQFLLAERGYTLVHAAAVADADGNVTLLPGPGGVGKTAILASLVRDHGYRVLGDDLVILSATGECLSFPRRFVLKPYHAAAYPELFADLNLNGAVRGKKSSTGKRCLQLVADNMPAKGLARAALRRAGLLDKAQAAVAQTREAGCLATVAVERIFGPNCVAPRGTLRRVVFLERHDGAAFQTRPMSPEALASRMFAIVHHEWADFMRPFWSMGALELIDMPAYMKRLADTMTAGVQHARASLLRIPADAPPQALAAKFLAIR